MTPKLFLCALAATAALATLPHFAAEARGGFILQKAPHLPGTVLRPIKLQFACVVAGTPVEFPNDIAISNTYNFATPAGVSVSYTAPFGNTGVVTLPSLAPGATHIVSNAIPGGHPAGAPCTATEI